MAKKSAQKKSVAKKPDSKVKKNLGFLAVFVFIFVVLYFMLGGTFNFLSKVDAPTVTPTPEDKITAVYTCPNGEKITATYDNGAGNVTVLLPTGAAETLPHALSADGARYANKDESLVFWNTGNQAMVEQNGVTTYQNCVTDTN
jgi:membrane-bound inhibitor of C-type lysozyme